MNPDATRGGFPPDVVLRAHTKHAKNKQLEIDAMEIWIRAERRLGELIATQRERRARKGEGATSTQ